MKTVLIGSGYWGSIVQQKLEQLSELKFVANSKTDLSKIIDDVDMVFVCTPTSSHYDVVKFCLMNNKNVFCEKPFTGSYEKAIELFNIAQKNKLNIAVDHVFLYRDEYKKIHDGNTIEFIWDKPEIIKENIIDSLLYHDLYMLIEFTKYIDWKIKLKIISDKKIYLNLYFKDKIVEIKYNRDCLNRKKHIIIDNSLIDFSVPSNDALYIMLQKIINKDFNYFDNNELCLKTLNLKEKIYNFINT